ncbi:MAG TPA: N-methyl-L-tryptophan oxidase [Chloroflexota bacterium]|nr:N-methyl-L-tryptophan oxidase [Chloroflexota bacterium]
MSSYDVIVLGLGAMGSAAAAHLARRGRRVLGLDAYARGHANGSSHGRSRIIREAYYEAPEYVPLVQRAYALWRALEEETGRDLLTITGGLNLGRPAGELVRGAVHSAQVHGLPYEQLTAAEVTGRFPGFRVPETMVAVYEPHAGFLQPEQCVAAHLDVALRHGAELQHETPVVHWSANGDGVRVETARDSYQAARLVITAGPWASEHLANLGLPLQVERIVNVHFEPTRPDLFARERCPIYIWEAPEGSYYGFPALPDQGLKFGRHEGGEICTPQTIRRTVDEGEVAALRRVLDTYMPGAAGAVKWTLTCMYTNTPDRHFILDSHPAYPQVVYGCGFSGHGFKFSSAIGEVLADLALAGTTRHDIGFLSARRFDQH